MTDRRFFWLIVASLLAILILAVLGVLFESFALLFNVLLAIVGILAGYLTSSHFAQKAERQNLGLFASAGYRLSTDIHDSVTEIIEKVEELKDVAVDGSKLSQKDVNLMLEIVSGKLKVLQRISLSANKQWRDVLPSEQLRTVELSNEREIQIIEEKHVLQRQMPDFDNQTKSLRFGGD